MLLLSGSRVNPRDSSREDLCESRNGVYLLQFRSYSCSIISRGFPLSVSGARSMTALVKRFASRNGCSNDGNEQLEAVEQESLINGSSELGKELVANCGIEAIVNRLSKWVVYALFASIILLRHDGTALNHEDDDKRPAKRDCS